MRIVCALRELVHVKDHLLNHLTTTALAMSDGPLIFESLFDHILGTFDPRLKIGSG